MTPGDHPLLENRLKGRLIQGDGPALCLRTTFTRTTEIAFVARAAGFDALYVDLEHCTASLADTGEICATASAIGVTPLVRLPSPTDDTCAKLLDAGSQGIIAPHVDTAEQARAVVAACKFPPLGERSASGAAFQLDYASIPMPELADRMNAATLVAVMIESPEAVGNAKEIAAVDGVDMLLVGTTDLSFQLGVAGEHDHPDIQAAYTQVAAACAGSAAFGAAGVGSAETVAKYVAMGARFVSAGRDVDFLLAGAHARVAELRDATGGAA